MLETWLDVLGFEDYFKVSNFGNVFSKRSGKILKLTIVNGYYQFSTRIGGRSGKTYALKAHRLVAEAFLESPSEYLIQEALNTKHKKVVVNHIDGNKLNNSSDNLEWATYKENTQHAIALGLITLRSKKESLRKISYKDAQYIRSVYRKGDKIFGQRALAKKY